ncbi:MAG: PSD1 domain-containing protein [Bryobacterales bacterium]|nr:PSD1 domain-containing protein [Bryobacterales bacterium]
MRSIRALTLLAATLGSAVAHDGYRVIESRCLQCHGEAVALSGLKLNSREGALRGGSRGAAVTPGDARASLLWQLLNHAQAPAMPPTGRLADGEIAAVRDWIDSGFAWPSETKAVRSEWWAFRKPDRPPAPPGDAAVDAFLDRAMRAKGLHPAPEADRRTLVRRAYRNLHGLPPTPEQVDAFLRDDSPDAWAKLIDALLESPRYGEKWGRFWLDLVRYGDTAGFETDPYHLDAWRYRDYVIKSANEDKPYDRFIREQLAGDEMWPGDAAAVTATGYFRVGPHRDLQVKVEEQNRIEKLSDYVETTSGVFLGLTLGCARCHDHKFDPLPQRDFLRMQAIFEPAVNRRHMLQPLALLSDVSYTKREFKLWQIGAQVASLYAPYEKQLRRQKLAGLPDSVLKAFETPQDQRSAEQQALVTEYNRQARVAEDEIREALSAEDRETLDAVEKRLVTIFRGYGPPPFVDGIGDAAPVWRVKDQIRPGFPAVVGGGDVPDAPEGAKSTGRRTALANWIASPENPLTARVMVNRIWQFHFGRGLVPTASDFGVRSGRPSHPELLDWLATEFVRQGWSVKAMHRLIMNTAAYRRSAAPVAKSREADPDNVFLSHMSRRRLTAEEIRDSVLYAAGELNLKIGGPPAVPPLDEEELYGIIGNVGDAWPVSPDPAQHNRRGIYLLARRTFVQPMFAVFDQPDGVGSCPRRNESTTAPQSLTLLNSRFTVDQARKLAAAAPDPAAMWRRVLGREPTRQEDEWVRAFLAAQAANQSSEEDARAELARALLNLNEFLYVD